MTISNLKSVLTKDLEIAYHESGPANGVPVILLHGFPYDPRAYDEVTPELNQHNLRCLVPYLRGYGSTTFLNDKTLRSGQQAAIASDLIAFMDALSISKAYLAGYDWGGRAACIVAALSPERTLGLVSCGQGYNIQDVPNAWKPAPVSEEMLYWYMYYFNTKRGATGLQQNRNEICKHIWKLWSPTWKFDKSTFESTVKSFQNPDFVDVVIHSYRHRFGDTWSDPQFDEIAACLAKQPTISVPTIVLQGADDTVDPLTGSDEAKQNFTAEYEKVILTGVGHNVPQEAPDQFAKAVLKLTER